MSKNYDSYFLFLCSFIYSYEQDMTIPLMILAINNWKHGCEKKQEQKQNLSVFMLMGKKVNEVSLLYCVEKAQIKPYP